VHRADLARELARAELRDRLTAATDLRRALANQQELVRERTLVDQPRPGRHDDLVGHPRKPAQVRR